MSNSPETPEKTEKLNPQFISTSLVQPSLQPSETTSGRRKTPTSLKFSESLNRRIKKKEKRKTKREGKEKERERERQKEGQKRSEKTTRVH